MTKLNKTDFILRLKRGLRANVYVVANYPMQGEPAYTTDTKHLYFGNASNIFEPVQSLDMAVFMDNEIVSFDDEAVFLD